MKMSKKTVTRYKLTLSEDEVLMILQALRKSEALNAVRLAAEIENAKLESAKQ